MHYRSKMVSPRRALLSIICLITPQHLFSIPHPKLHYFRVPAGTGRDAPRPDIGWRPIISRRNEPDNSFRYPARYPARDPARRPIFNYFCAVIPSYYGISR